jgi:hypothetical protein
LILFENNFLSASKNKIEENCVMMGFVIYSLRLIFLARSDQRGNLSERRHTVVLLQSEDLNRRGNVGQLAVDANQ